MENSTTNTIVWSVLAGLVIFTALILNLPIFIYKTRRTKQDILIAEKYTFQIFCFIYFLFFPILNIFNLAAIDNYTVNNYFLTAYFIGDTVLTLMISIEDYRSVQNPFYVFDDYLKTKSKGFIHETICIGLICLSMLFAYIAEQFDIFEDLNSCYLVLNNLGILLFCLFLAIGILVINVMKYGYIRSYLSENKLKAAKLTRLEIMSNVFKVIILLCYTLVSIENRFKVDIDDIVFTVLNYIFLAISLSVNIIEQVIVSRTDYFYYSMGNTKLGYFYKIYFPKVFTKPTLTMEYSSFIGSKENSLAYFHDKLAYNVEEYIVDEIESSLNITLASLFIIYSKLAKASMKSEEKMLTKDKDSPTSSESEKKPRLSDKSDLESFTLEQIETAKDVITTEYVFKRNEHINDFDHSEEKLKIHKLLNPNDKDLTTELKKLPELTLKLKAYNIQDFTEIILSKGKIDLFNTINTAFLSHHNNNSLQNLFSKNCKDEMFRNQKRFILKTFDKGLNIEIIIDDGISTHFLQSYTKYMKNNKKSFLPLILGVFKVKVNHLKELTVILSKNKIVEDVPKDYFNYWQLLRLYPDNKLEMVTSSKDRTSYLIQDDLIIFKTDGARLNLNNFTEFSKIMESDIGFFMDLKIKGFKLLIMYYELGKLNQQNISIDEGNNNRISVGGITLRPSRMSAGFSEIKSEGGKWDNSVFDFSLRQELTFVLENHGFEANFNDFKCVLFFIFDDIIYNDCGSNASLCSNIKPIYYENYFKLIQDKFEESILK
jgi:hypothetical protein